MSSLKECQASGMSELKTKTGSVQMAKMLPRVPFLRSRFGRGAWQWQVLWAALFLLLAAAALAAFPYRLAVAVHTVEPLHIDGDLGDWVTDKAILLGPQNQVLTGQAVYFGAEDLSGRFYLMWDKETLYVAGEMKDDSVTAGEAWDTDRVNFVFDLNNDTDRFSYDSANPGTSEWQTDDYWVFCRPFVDEEYTRGQVFRIARDFYGEVEGATIVARRTDDGYRFEMSLPVKSLPELIPYVGKVVGFDLFVTDGDGEAEVTEIMWANRWQYDSGGIYWQWWKLDRLVFADTPIRP
jgi:hypothetical protein